MSIAAAGEAAVVTGALSALIGVTPEATRQEDGTYIVRYTNDNAKIVRSKITELVKASKSGKTTSTTPRVRYDFKNVYRPVLLDAAKWYLLGTAAAGLGVGYLIFKGGEAKGRKNR